MARAGSKSVLLTLEEKGRLTSLLGAVSSRTLLKVLRDMEGHNADAQLIIEVLLERSLADDTATEVRRPSSPGSG